MLYFDHKDKLDKTMPLHKKLWVVPTSYLLWGVAEVTFRSVDKLNKTLARDLEKLIRRGEHG